MRDTDDWNWVQMSLSGGSNQQRSETWSKQFQRNNYRIVDPVSRSSAIYPYAGFKRIDSFDVGASNFVGRPKGGIKAGPYMIFVLGNLVFRRDAAGATTNIGEIDTTTGPVKFSLNNKYVSLVDGAWQYNYDVVAGGMMTKNTDPDTPLNPNYITQQTSLTLMNSGQTQDMYQSAPGAPFTFNPLNFEVINFDSFYLSNPLVAFESVNGRIITSTTGFIQILVNKGVAGFTFQPDENLTASGIGVCAAASVDVGVVPTQNKKQPQVFCGLCQKSDGNYEIITSSGGLPETISTVSKEFQLSDMARNATIDDAVGFMFADNGQTFYQLTFPTHDVTWSYNFATAEWQDQDYKGGRHPAQCMVPFNGKRYFTSAFDNGLYEASEIYVTQTIKSDGAYVEIAPEIELIFDNIRLQGNGKSGGYFQMVGHRFRLYLQQGIGEAGIPYLNAQNYSQAADPQVWAFVSKDGGNTFSPLEPASAGRAGQYDYLTEFLAPGIARDWIFKIKYQAPVPFYMMGAQFAYTIFEGTQ